MLNKIGRVVVVIAAITFVVSLYLLTQNQYRSNTLNDVTYDSLIKELKAYGNTISIIEPGANETKHTFFSVYPKYIDIGKERIAIYEFDRPAAAANEAKTISGNGSKIGNSYIEWVDTPHFYVRGNLIVGYAGRNNSILNDLAIILGEPVTDKLTGKTGDVNKSIDEKLYAIVHNPKAMFSSNPYDYVKDNEDYKYILKQGDNALNYMLGKFESSNDNGLEAYIMAIACSEIIGENTDEKNWSSGREWYEEYMSK